MKYALAIAAILSAISHHVNAGGNPFVAGFAQGFMQTQQPYVPYVPQYNSSMPPIPSIPPIGASSCRPIRVCDATGWQCVWEQVCR